MFQDYHAPKMTREDRKAKMHAQLVRAGRSGITATMLIRQTGLKRNPYSLGILDELVGEGLAVWEGSALTNGLPCRVYFDSQVWGEMIAEYDPQAGNDDMLPEDLPF